MKYNNENPIDKLHEGEPYFFLRAQDCYSVGPVIRYAGILLENGDYDGAQQVIDMAKKMEEWQKANPRKVKKPD